MVIVLLFASLLGGAITLALHWPYGALVAVLSAPLGGSTMAVLMGGLIALRGAGYDESFDPTLKQRTDEMVAVLRQAAEQLHRSGSLPALPTEPGRQAA